MVKEQKDLYVSPEVTTLEIKAQAIICQSGSNEDYDNTNDPDLRSGQVQCPDVRNRLNGDP